MKETFEFRLDAKVAAQLFGRGVGRVRDGIAVIRLDSGDPMMATLGEALLKRLPVGSREGIFYSWDVRRTYSDHELERAELVQLAITRVFEPPGEDCGTRYEESTACQHCGAGRIQISPLSLDLRISQPERDVHTSVLRRGVDFAKSIADEVVISDRMSKIAPLSAMNGFAVQPVLRCDGGPELSDWHQLVVRETVEAVPPTLYGINPFELDESGEYRCPLGHVAGLNLLSEVTVDRGSWSGADIVRTRQLTGLREGSLVPAPTLLISPAAFRALRDAGVKGARFEVAHLS